MRLYSKEKEFSGQVKNMINIYWVISDISYVYIYIILMLYFTRLYYHDMHLTYCRHIIVLVTSLHFLSVAYNCIILLLLTSFVQKV